MNLGVIGSRNIFDFDLEEEIFKLMKNKEIGEVTSIVSGGALGVDTLGEQFADKYNIDKIIFLPDYDTYGRKAPLVRNELILDKADFVLVVWDGVSRGTLFGVNYVRKNNIPHKIITVY